jgi:hypothetical protein
MQGALQYYSGDVGKALVDIFPHVPFVPSKFPKVPGRKKRKEKDRKRTEKEGNGRKKNKERILRM